MKTQWKITEAANHWRIDDGESPVCDVIRGVDGKDNAALIASAPELLNGEENKIRLARKALEEIQIGNLETAETYLEMLIDDTAAISKAKGE